MGEVSNAVEIAKETPPSPEQIAGEIEARTETFNHAIFDAPKTALEMGVTGEEADALTSRYDEIAEKLRQHMRGAANVARAGIMATAMALGPMAAAANDVEPHQLDREVAEFANSEEPMPPPTSELALKETTPKIATEIEKNEPEAELITELPPDEEVPADDPQAELASQNSETDEERGVRVQEEFRATEHTTPVQTWKELRDSTRREKDMTVATELAMSTQTEGGMTNFFKQHGGFIAEKWIPGAGIKQAFSGTNEYGERLTGAERATAFGKGILNLATLGKADWAAKVVNALRVKSAAENIVEKSKILANNPSINSAASAVSEIAGIIPGGQTVEKVAGVVSFASGAQMARMRSSASYIIKSATMPNPVQTSQETEKEPGPAKVEGHGE